MKTIYFAHPYKTWKTKEEAEIENILKNKNYEPINAFNRIENSLIDKFGGEYYENASEEFAAEIVKGDFNLVDECDEYIGWFPMGSMCIGSSIELYHAYTKNKPIIVICESPHPFLYNLATKYYTNIENFDKGLLFKLPNHILQEYF